MSDRQENSPGKQGPAKPGVDETQSRQPPDDTWDNPPSLFQRLKEFLGFQTQQARQPPPDTVDQPPPA